MTVPFTRCDYELCKKSHAVLYKIAHELKTMYNLQEEEFKYQKGQAKKLWNFAQRYQILEKGAPGVSIYPDIAVNMVKCAMRTEMNEIINNIHTSNEKMRDAIKLLTPLYGELDAIVKEIDWTADGGMIKGDEIFKPLAYYIQSVSDWRKSFKRLITENQVLEDLLDIEFCCTVEAYLSHLDLREGSRDLFAKEMCFVELMYPK